MSGSDIERADLERTIKEAQQAGVEFVLADAESAHGFVDIAERTSDPAAFERNISQARRMLASMSAYLAHGEGNEILHEKACRARDKLQQRLAALKR